MPCTFALFVVKYNEYENTGSQNNMKQRIYYLDLLRCIAILMVILLHSISTFLNPKLYGSASYFPFLTVNAFTRIGVPIFLMISGALLLSSESASDMGKFYKKRIPHLLIPLLFWNAAYFVYNYLMGQQVFDPALLFSKALVSGTKYHLWYMYTMLAIYLVVPFLKIIADRCTDRQLWWLVLLMTFGTTVRPFINITTPLYLYLFDPLFNGYIGCFMLGYVLSRVKRTKLNVIISAAAGVFGLLFSVIYHHLHSSADKLDLSLNNGFSLCHYALAASVFLLVKFIFETEAPLAGAVALLSKCSFGMYLIHVAVIELTRRFIMIDSTPIIVSCYIFAVCSALSFAVALVLSKIKYINKLVL